MMKKWTVEIVLRSLEVDSLNRLDEAKKKNGWIGLEEDLRRWTSKI